MFKNIKWLIFAVIITLLFTACADGGEDDSENISKLKDGDLIVRENVNEMSVAVSGFDTFNPIMTKSSSVAEFMKTVCEPLFEYDDAHNPIGVLAENYAVSGDGMTVSFNVVGVKFHDSTTLSARDVIYTVNMIRNNDTLYSDSVKYIDDIFSDNEGRVYIRLWRPVVNFAGMLNFPIVKEGTPAISDANYIPIGTGPCKYFGKKNSNQVSFSAHEEWHGGKTGFKNIVVNILKDSNTMVHAFDAGEVDVFATAVSKNSEVTPRGEYSISEYTSDALTFLGINNQAKKLTGKWTRKALELLCDRDKIIDVEVYSKGKAARVPITPSAWFYPSFSEPDRDYEAVTAMLSKDGWVKGDDGFKREVNGQNQVLSLKILVNKDNPEKIRIAKNIAASFTTFGIPATTREVSFDMYKNEVAEKNYELFVGEVMADDSMDPYFLTVPGDNYFNYQNQTLNGILHEAGKSADSSVIMDKMTAYADTFIEEMPFIPLFFRTESVIYNKNISGISKPNSYMIYRDIDKWYISKANQ